MQADRCLVDEVGDAVRRVGARRACQVRTVAVRPADARKPGQVGAAQGERLDLHVVDVTAQRGASALPDAFQQRRQSTGVDADVVDLALAEGQGALQVQEVGHHDLREADVQPHELAAVEIQPHGRAARGDDQALVLARADAGVHRHRAQQPVQCLAAVVHFHRDAAPQNAQDVAQAVDPEFIGAGLQREGLLGLVPGGQVRREGTDGDVQVLQAETDQAALAGQGHAEVGVAEPDEDTDVAAAEADALVLDVAQRGEVT